MTTADNEIDRDGRSQLHIAAAAGDTRLVSKLIADGADHDLQDGMGMTPLHLAAQEYSVEAARLLLDAGASVDSANEQGNSPLFVATFNARGRGEMIKLLRQRGADPDLVNHHGQTPRGLAELIGNYDVGQFLAE